MENNASAILEGLNSEQKAAVSCVGGPVLIVAGAGSGKTRVLTSRIAYILDNGCEPERILALTFTKKAASEMKERISGMVGPRKARKLYMGTFHSVFIRFLREYAQSLGYPETFTIYDTSDSISAIKACIKELQLDDKVYKPKDVLSRISMAKNNMVTADRYKTLPKVIQVDTERKRPRICDIYMLYQQKCVQSGVMDFDDILVNMYKLLVTNKEAFDNITGRFEYIMVDEYQDTNMAQYSILKALASPHKNICVVGDDSQSIYAFRGARIQNILNFKKDYPQCRVFRLEQNYRSTKNIVDAANSLIARNSTRIPKKCYSEGECGEKIRLISAFTEGEEALLVASDIVSRMQSEGAHYQDFAILYRTNAQSRSFEEAFRRRNLPYMIYSGNSFYERAEVKDMMAYLKLVANVNDDESFKRIVNKPARGIGDTSLAALTAAAHENKVSLFAAGMRDDLDKYGLRSAASIKIRAFCDMIAKASASIPERSAHSLAVALSIDSGLYPMYKADTSIEGQSRTANVEELLSSIKSFIEERNGEYLEDLQADGEDVEGKEFTEKDFPLVTLNEYLENVSLLSSVDVDEEDKDKITLMTVHSSKGLEYPYVYVVGMEENIFPSGSFSLLESEIEEERRLFYVAMTRAKKVLQLSFAQTRMRNGKHEENGPSRFIGEIDPQYVKNPISTYGDSDNVSVWRSKAESRTSSGSYGSYYGNRSQMGGSRYGSSGRVTSVPSAPKPITSRVIKPKPTPAKRVADADFIPTPIMELAEGQRIEHNRFGYGVIKEMFGSGSDIKAKIAFDDHEDKILILKFAKIRRVQ